MSIKLMGPCKAPLQTICLAYFSLDCVEICLICFLYLMYTLILCSFNIVLTHHISYLVFYTKLRARKPTGKDILTVEDYLNYPFFNVKITIVISLLHNFMFSFHWQYFYLCMIPFEAVFHHLLPLSPLQVNELVDKASDPLVN